MKVKNKVQLFYLLFYFMLRYESRASLLRAIRVSITENFYIQTKKSVSSLK